MTDTIIWSKRIQPKDKDFINQTLQLYKEVRGFETDRDALVDIFKNLFAEPTSAILPDIITSESQREIENICEAGFLQKLEIDRAGPQWYCLREMSKTGKRISLGRDIQSVKKQCESCHTGMILSQQYAILEDKTRAILELGDKAISIKVYGCVNYIPPRNAPQVQIGEDSQFFCPLRRKTVTIKNTCMRDKCECLVSQEFKLPLNTTQGYRDFQRAIEGPK